MNERSSSRVGRDFGQRRSPWAVVAMVAAAIAATVTGAIPAAAAPVYYHETGDAGDFLNPQAIGPAGVVFNGIEGTIGGSADPVDAFSFFYGGGSLGIRTVVGGTQFLSAGLWAFPQDAVTPTDPITPTGGDPAIGLVTFVKLAAGNYIVQVAKAGGDPPILIDFLQGPSPAFPPTTESPPAEVTAPRPVPEPGGLALVALGLIGLEAEWLARRSRSAG